MLYEQKMVYGTEDGTKLQGKFRSRIQHTSDI